ncbi:hypothetical protein PoB_002430600 [Plakobranchus ocellatus]|uniref:Uncharacterized protein n=1 Tax=Plakobranchus ocellatus TaxID=259542 RepID=A0AAV3ZPE2_9GAST|nr:hypothetical protein PoB_002430600 [Plakobranchus ocellatus]
MQIRLLTLLELILNRSHYDYEHEAFVDHCNDDRLVFDRFDTVLKDIATEFSYCGMMALSGISAALSVPIQSYCPPTQGGYFLSEPLARDGHFVSTEPDILPGGKSLPLGRFLETEKVIEILKRTPVNDTLSEVPRGKKDDVYFVVQNENNKDRRAQGKRSQFWDDRGAWECNSTSRSYFLQENEKLRSVTYRQTKYCIQVRQNKNYVHVPLNPQPQAEDVLVLSRYYAKHKTGAGYEKRVPFLHSEKYPAFAVHEFKGCCPELKHHAYVRTKPQVIDKIKKEVIVKKVGEIYSSNEDVLEGPSNRRQIYNIKAQSQTKSQVIPKANFADQVSALEELQHTMPFEKLIVRQYKKVPSVILYTEEQISDIKRFCCPPVTAESTVLGFDKTFNLSN